ncbi:hypothetical protein [Levilactobacillus fujinensis]|uniref:Uncharacterized protein n=1 Tax=Levilactobacillus fujinensis TaxID=2486024 RepID=A0ABW1TKR2_9LACO|nr:hypothetical protein [Levilactobacillus fujinensis]
MTKDKIALIVLVVLAVGLLSLVLMLMKSVLWVAFPLVFAILGLACYSIENWLEKSSKKNEREA